MAYGAPRSEALKEFECGTHSITYRARKAGCPVCEMERYTTHLVNEQGALENKYRMLNEEAMRLKVQVDLVYAIKEAVLVIGKEDIAFLKSVLYQWRDERSVMLKVTHGVAKNRKQGQPNGFIAVYRKQDPMGHACSSIGGFAIAEYFEEAINSLGQAKAMAVLARGLSAQLSGRMEQTEEQESEAPKLSRLSEFVIEQGRLMHLPCRAFVGTDGKSIRNMVIDCREHALTCLK